MYGFKKTEYLDTARKYPTPYVTLHVFQSVTLLLLASQFCRYSATKHSCLTFPSRLHVVTLCLQCESVTFVHVPLCCTIFRTSQCTYLSQHGTLLMPWALMSCGFTFLRTESHRFPSAPSAFYKDFTVECGLRPSVDTFCSTPSTKYADKNRLSTPVYT